MKKLSSLRHSKAAKATIRIASAAAGAIALHGPAAAQALQPVVKASNIASATCTAIALAILTVSWGMAGYKMAFGGASFRDVAGSMIGGAIGGAAATVAGVFMG